MTTWPIGTSRRDSAIPYLNYRKLHLGTNENVYMFCVGQRIIFIHFMDRRFKLLLANVGTWINTTNQRLQPFKLWLRGYQSKFYVNVYQVDRNYGGSEEGGWWWNSYVPFNDIQRNSWGCDTLEEARMIKEWLTTTLINYQPARNRYSVIGGPDIEAIIEEHTPLVQPTHRPYYC